jgi:putative membrane protein
MAFLPLIQKALIGLVAALHFYFLVLEMFLWTRPLGLRTFGMTMAQATDRAVLAANQGLYNGFLAAGLIWSLVHPDAGVSFQLSLFFLSCVVIAALYGAYSVSSSILIIQGLPAALALLSLLLYRSQSVASATP